MNILSYLPAKAVIKTRHMSRGFKEGVRLHFQNTLTSDLGEEDIEALIQPDLDLPFTIILKHVVSDFGHKVTNFIKRVEM